MLFSACPVRGRALRMGFPFLDPKGRGCSAAFPFASARGLRRKRTEADCVDSRAPFSMAHGGVRNPGLFHAGGRMKAGVGYSNGENSYSCGKAAAEAAVQTGGIRRPGLVFAFCHGNHDHRAFLGGLRSVVGDSVPVVGGSSIGVITNNDLSYERFPTGVAVLEAGGIHCRVGSAGDVNRDERAAGKKLAERFSLIEKDRLFLLFYDSIKAPSDGRGPPLLNASTPLIEGVASGLDSRIPIIGAGLLGDYGFGPTQQFCGSHVSSQSAVGVSLDIDFHVRIMHGCTPLDGVYRSITKMEGATIYELDGRPIVEVIDELYGNTEWRKSYPVALLTLGQNHGPRFGAYREDRYVNRLITGVLPDGRGVNIFEPDFECGSEIQFMLRDTGKMIESARKNSSGLMRHITEEAGRKPLFGLYIDCAGRSGGYSNTASEEAAEVQDVFNRYGVPLLGFYSGVEIAPLLRRSRGLDWTGVLLVLTGE